MIRGWLCLVVIIIATGLAFPALPNFYHNYSPNIHYSPPVANPDPLNITGASTAFNYTLSAANIFTNATSKEMPAVNSTQFKWFSTINETRSGIPIQGTAFNYTASPIPAAASQKVAWNLTIPKTSCSTCSTFISFTLYGSLTLGTNETFTIANATSPTTLIESGIFKGINATQLSICTLASTSNATVCGPTVKVAVPNKYLGSTLTLTFQFMGNATGGGKIKTSVGEVVVESLDNTIKNSDSNFMVQTGTPSIVTHTSSFLKVRYNATSSPTSWTNEVLNVYYPSGYNLTSIQMNGTIPVFPITSHVPFEKDNCNDGIVPCKQALLAINMSDISGYPVLHNSTITLTSITLNSMKPLSTLSGGVATEFFTSGDQIGVKVVNSPSIKNDTVSLQTGQLTISFSPQLSIQNSTVPTAAGGVYNFTLPSSCTGSLGPICNQKWTVSALFKSPYDIGNSTATFRIDLLQVTSFSPTGGSNSLTVQGTIQYGNGTAAKNLNTTLFAIDQGISVSGPNSAYAASHSSSHLYVSNVTLVNGAFAPGQSLTLLISVVNPNATQAFNATLAIEHDWPGPQRHNVTASVFLGLGDGLGDFAFTNSTVRTFKVTISFTGTGVQTVVTSLSTGNPTSPKILTQGTSPVLPNRPHAGLFNFTITSMINNQAQGSSASILSPTYAYVPTSLSPARYLYASPAFLTNAAGSFSQTISSNSLLGAKNLTVFVLARDTNGIVVVNNLPSTGFTDSTTLVANADSIGPVAKGQAATATLHLTSNATRTNGITEYITVILTLQGNGLPARTVATKAGVIISPGATATIPLTFTAPNSTGSYTLTFSSPEYGGILTSQTLQVTIISTSLQLLIPAAIGVVAAIIILGVYLVRGKDSSEKVEEEAKPKGLGPKPKPTSTGSPPAKSLTRTEDADK